MANAEALATQKLAVRTDAQKARAKRQEKCRRSLQTGESITVEAARKKLAEKKRKRSTEKKSPHSRGEGKKRRRRKGESETRERRSDKAKKRK